MNDALEKLANELGPVLERHAPLALEGATIEATLRPESAEACAGALGARARAGVGVLVQGGGTRLEAANAPCRARVRLATTGLRAEPEIDFDEGVARIAAGATLAELHARLAAESWELPLDPPGDAATLGGALASAAIGPRFGHPRDVVLGIQVALASGELVKAGGRVVKNVTGYDLNKLFVGSNGSLGVITSAWVRLRPRPERCDVLVAPAPEDPRLVLSASRAPSVRVAALVDSALAPELCAAAHARRALVLELAGDEAAVAADRAALAPKLGEASAPASTIDDVRTAQARGPVRFRLAALPSELAPLSAALAAAGAATLSFPARGLAYAVFALPPGAGETHFDAQLAAVRAAAQRAGAAWRIEAAPAALRAGREVCGERDGTLALQRAVKQSYDPRGILNPGRGLGAS